MKQRNLIETLEGRRVFSAVSVPWAAEIVHDGVRYGISYGHEGLPEGELFHAIGPVTAGTPVASKSLASDAPADEVVNGNNRWTITYDNPRVPLGETFHFAGFVDTSATASKAAAPVSEDGDEEVISPTLAADPDDGATWTLVTDPDEIAALLPERPTELVHGNVRYTLTYDHPSGPDITVFHFAGFVDDALPGEEQPDTLLA